MLCRKLTTRRVSRRRSRSISSTPTEINYDVHKRAEARTDAEAHSNFETCSNFETRRIKRARGRSETRRSGEAHGNLQMKNCSEVPGSDEVHSDSDDEFYVKAVHSTFFDCSGSCARKSEIFAKRTASRCTRRSASGLLGPEAPAARLKNNLLRLGRFTKEVVVPRVRGVFADNTMVNSETEAGEKPADGYSRFVNGIVSMFFSRDKSEQGDVDDCDELKRPNKPLPFLTGTGQLSSLYPRRQGNELPSRTASEFSSEEVTEVTDLSDLPDEATPPVPGVTERRRSLNSAVSQWRYTPEASTPPCPTEEERYFELLDTPRNSPVGTPMGSPMGTPRGTPRDRLMRSEVVEYSGLFGTMTRATRFFMAATVLLMAGVVHKFALVSVVMYNIELFVPVSVMVGLTTASTFIAVFLIFEDYRKRRGT